MKRTSRRRFLTTAGVALGGALVGPSIFNPKTVFAAAPLVRRDVGGMDAFDPILLTYRKAIKAMQLLPSSNPLSWAYQAAIHGTTLPGSLPAWRTCQHGNYFFWSWHRMYLYWFERIIRKMGDDSCWALPYWNWSSPTERQLPAPFLDSGSELYIPTPNRSAGMNGGGSLPSSDVSYSSSFAQTNFTTTSLIIQGTPHGAVHVDVGGWMGSVPTAAQDPIFYLHHANMDRLWDLWLAQGGGRSDPLGDTTWKSTPFTFFNETGTQVTMTACEVLRAAQQLNYVYEGEPPQVNQNCLRIIRPTWLYQIEVLFKLPIPPVTLGPEPVSFPLDLKQLRERIAPLVESTTDTLFLTIDAEADRPPGAVWEVYRGLPANTEPKPDSPFYIGNVVLFGEGIRSEAHGEFKPAHFLFPINRALAAGLRATEERLPVTFVPRGIIMNGKLARAKVESPVHISGASVTVERQRQQ